MCVSYILDLKSFAAVAVVLLEHVDVEVVVKTP
jgi:hypothetical protein